MTFLRGCRGKSFSIMVGTVIGRLSVGSFPSWAGGGEDAVWAQESRGDCLAGGKLQPSAAAVSSHSQLLPPGTDPQLLGAVLLLCEPAAPANSFQVFGVRLWLKRQGEGQRGVAKKGKSIICLCVSAPLGSAARGDRPVLPYKHKKICTECI